MVVKSVTRDLGFVLLTTESEIDKGLFTFPTRDFQLVMMLPLTELIDFEIEPRECVVPLILVLLPSMPLSLHLLSRKKSKKDRDRSLLCKWNSQLVK